MAHINADRVADTSITTGTGPFTAVASPPPGFRSFSAVAAVNDTFFYCIAHQSVDEWETGLATYSAANEFTRTRVFQSSNSNNAVNFSAGTKDCFITPPAATMGRPFAMNVIFGR